MSSFAFTFLKLEYWEISESGDEIPLQMNNINHLKRFKNWMKITQGIMIKRAEEGIVCLEVMLTGGENMAVSEVEMGWCFGTEVLDTQSYLGRNKSTYVSSSLWPMKSSNYYAELGGHYDSKQRTAALEVAIGHLHLE